MLKLDEKKWRNGLSGSDAIVIFGPTGSGKTELSIELARRIGGEIINLDSMQVYQEIEIGTAKPSLDERALVPHHLFDLVSVKSNFTVADYQGLAREKIQEIKARGNMPIFVGGTGLYLSSLYYDFSFRPETDRLETLPQEAEISPSLAELIDVKNPRRVRRALLTGEVHPASKRERSDLKLLIFWLDWPRDILHDRINQRVDFMMERGLLDEVRQMQENFRLADTSSARQGIGYKELVAYLDGEMDLDRAVERIKIHTRQYAKRQITWVRNQYDTVYRLEATDGVDALIKQIIHLEALSYEE